MSTKVSRLTERITDRAFLPVQMKKCPSTKAKKVFPSSTGESRFPSSFRLESSSDDENTEPFVFASQRQKTLIEEILERKARQHAHLQHLLEYPKILRYLLENDRNPSSMIPLRHVEPFIIAHVSTTPSGKIYDKIVRQIEEIRRSYLQLKHRN